MYQWISSSAAGLLEGPRFESTRGSKLQSILNGRIRSSRQSVLPLGECFSGSHATFAENHYMIQLLHELYLQLLCPHVNLLCG